MSDNPSSLQTAAETDKLNQALLLDGFHSHTLLRDDGFSNPHWEQNPSTMPTANTKTLLRDDNFYRPHAERQTCTTTEIRAHLLRNDDGFHPCTKKLPNRPELVLPNLRIE